MQMRMSAKKITETVTIIVTITSVAIIVPVDRVTSFNRIRSLVMVSVIPILWLSDRNLLNEPSVVMSRHACGVP